MTRQPGAPDPVTAPPPAGRAALPEVVPGTRSPTDAAAAPRPPIPPGLVIRRWTLAFGDPRVEADYLSDEAARSLGASRIILGLALALYAGFGLLDPFIIPEATREAWLIRYAVVCPVAAALLALTFHRRFLPRIHAATAFLAVLAGTGMVTMTVLASGAGRERYYAGLLLVVAFVYTFSHLRFQVATAISWSVTAYHLAALPFDRALTTAALVNNVLFLLAFHVLGMTACYVMERSTRRDYLQRRVIADQAAHLADALASVKVLSGLLPICAWCHKVRSDGGYWQQIEAYVSARTDASFSHGICPACAERMEREDP